MPRCTTPNIHSLDSHTEVLRPVDEKGDANMPVSSPSPSSHRWWFTDLRRDKRRAVAISRAAVSRGMRAGPPLPCNRPGCPPPLPLPNAQPSRVAHCPCSPMQPSRVAHRPSPLHSPSSPKRTTVPGCALPLLSQTQSRPGLRIAPPLPNAQPSRMRITPPLATGRRRLAAIRSRDHDA